MSSLVFNISNPTAICHSFVCNFTDASVANLVLCKINHIEIYRITADSVVLCHDIPVSGRVALIQSFRSKTDTQDSILVTTEKFNYFVIKYARDEIVTRSYGNLKDIFGKTSDIGQLGGIDNQCSVMALFLLQGVIRVYPVASKPNEQLFKPAFNVRIAELNVLSVAFLHDKETPVVALLYSSQNGRHVKTYEFDFKGEGVVEGAMSFADCDVNAHTLIPIPKPIGGCIILGTRLIAYKAWKGDTAVGLEMPSSVRFTSHCMINTDGSRWLLGDSCGGLHHLVLLRNIKNEVTSMTLEPLGTTVISSSLSYIDNGIVFVGSRCGDHQLIKLSSCRNESGSMFEVIERFDNLAPVLDFQIADLNQSGHSQMIASCGAYKEGSIRIIQSGLLVDAKSAIDLSSLRVKNIWSLHQTTSSKFQSYLFLSLVGESKIFSITDEIEEIDGQGFTTNEESFYVGNVRDDCLIQISESTIKLLTVFANKVIVKRKWDSTGGKIILADYFCDFAAVCNSNGHSVHVFECNKENGIVEKAVKKFDKQLSCLSVTTPNANHILLSFWGENDVCVMDRQMSALIMKFSLIESNAVCRSIKCVKANEADLVRVFIGFASGQMQVCLLKSWNEVLENKLVCIGKNPINLKLTPIFGASLLACSDRPMIIGSFGSACLNYKGINLTDVVDIAPFHTEAYPSCYAFLKSDSLVIGSLESQKLHIKTIHIGETVKRICFDRSSGTVAALTLKISSEDSVEFSCILRQFNCFTFELIASYEFENAELCNTLELLTLNDVCYFAVGSGIIDSEKEEPTEGYVTLFRTNENKTIEKAYRNRVDGSVYCLSKYSLSADKFCASYSDSLAMFQLSCPAPNCALELNRISVRKGFITILNISCYEDLIVVGDLLKSITVLAFNTESKIFDVIAKDYNIGTIMCQYSFSRDKYLCADDFGNLISLRRNPDAPSDMLRKQLATEGCFYLGDAASRFRPGNFSPSCMGSSMVNATKNVTFATSSGAIGSILQLSSAQFKALEHMEKNLSKIIKPAGNIDIEAYRSFMNDRRSMARCGFIDGNLVDLFSELDVTLQREVLRGTEDYLDAFDIKKLLEDIKCLS